MCFLFLFFSLTFRYQYQYYLFSPEILTLWRHDIRAMVFRCDRRNPRRLRSSEAPLESRGCRLSLAGGSSRPAGSLANLTQASDNFRDMENPFNYYPLKARYRGNKRVICSSCKTSRVSFWASLVRLINLQYPSLWFVYRGSLSNTNSLKWGSRKKINK